MYSLPAWLHWPVLRAVRKHQRVPLTGPRFLGDGELPMWIHFIYFSSCIIHELTNDALQNVFSFAALDETFHAEYFICVSVFSCSPGYVGNPQEREKCRPYDGKATLGGECASKLCVLIHRFSSVLCLDL